MKEKTIPQIPALSHSDNEIEENKNKKNLTVIHQNRYKTFSLVQNFSEIKNVKSKERNVFKSKRREYDENLTFYAIQFMSTEDCGTKRMKVVC